MQNRTKRFLWLAIMLLLAGVMGWLILGGKSTSAAAQYKAELRAKGEKITFVDLGFPKSPEDGKSLSVLTNAIGRIQMQGFKASSLTYPTYPSETVQGRQRVLWRGDGLPSDLSSNQVTWAEISAC